MDNFNIRHRNVLRHHYTRTSNVLLFGYRGVSDGAKLTYQVIDSFDWVDNAGTRKGFANPSVARLARIRHSSERTIQRHLLELEQARLLTREERPAKPSILVIEDPSQTEIDAYLHEFGRGGPDARAESAYSERGDKNVTTTPTRMSPPSIQENQREESQKNVEQALVGEGRQESSDSTHISTTLQHRRLELESRRRGRADHHAGLLADELCRELGDLKSRSFYLSVARTVPAQLIYEVLGEVKETWHAGGVKVSRGAVFTRRLQQLGRYRWALPETSSERAERGGRRHLR